MQNVQNAKSINEVVNEYYKKCRRYSLDEYEKKFGELPKPFRYLKHSKAKIEIFDKNELGVIIAGLVAFGKALGESIFGQVIESISTLINPWIVLPIRHFAINVYGNQIFDATRTAMYDTTFITTRQDPSGVNINDEDFRKMILDLAYDTVVLTTLVSEDAGEVAFENLQNALSNCTMAGIGGALTQMGNYRVGLQPISGLEESDEYMNVHVDTRSVIDAFAGFPIHYTVTKEALRRIKQASDAYNGFRVLREVIDAQFVCAYPWLEIATLVPVLFRMCLESLFHDVKSAVYTLWRRVVDIAQQLRVAKAEYESKLLSEDEFNLILYDAYVELKEIENELNEILNSFEDALKNIDELKNYAQLMRNIVANLVSIYRNYVNDVILSDFNKYVQNIQNIRSGYVKLSNVKYVLSV